MAENLIYLSYHYPPFGGVPVQRVVRFTRYLHEQGFQTTVVCAQPPPASSVPLDPDLVFEIPPEVSVCRVPSFEPECYVNSWSRPWDKIRRNLFKTFAGVLVPDDQALWIERAARATCQQKGQVIVATGPPFSTMLAGLRASQRSGLPLVLDFRDDWTGIRRSKNVYRPTRQAREEALERAVLEHAQAVITVTPTLVDDLKQRSPHPERLHLLPNGFDPDHFPEPARGFGDGVVFYAGSLYPKREPQAFFEAWSQYQQAQSPRLRFELAGPVTDDCRHYFEPQRTDCRWLGFLGHHEVRRRLQQSSLNLLWLDPYLSAQALTGKLLEYLGARRPVLLLGPTQSAAAQLVQRAGLGCAVEIDDVAGILAQLQRADRGEWPCQPDNEAIAPYDVRRQVKQLAAILRNAIAGDSRTRIQG